VTEVLKVVGSISRQYSIGKNRYLNLFKGVRIHLNDAFVEACIVSYVWVSLINTNSIGL
jgi:hypothetical protein